MALPFVAAAAASSILQSSLTQALGGGREPGVYGYRSYRSLKSINLSGAQFYASYQQGILEDGSSSLGGTASAAIDVPPVIARYILQKLGAVTSGNFTTGASTFGSFTQAITDLNAKVSGDWQMRFGKFRPENLGADIARICQQTPMHVWYSHHTGKWCCQVYKATPDTWDYFTDLQGNPYEISYAAKDMVGEPSIDTTLDSESLSEVHVHYRPFAPSGAYTRETWVGPTASDDGTGTRDQNGSAPDNRETVLSDTASQLGVNEVRHFEFDSLYLDTTGVAMRNYLADRFHRGALVIDLTVWARFAGIEPAQIVKISDDWLDEVGPPPIYPYGMTPPVAWSDLDFFVAAAPRYRNQNGRPVIDLRLQQVM